jgi:mono/diheme cytochrome c family protein
MLRETRAKWLALGTAVLVAAMAAVFAALRNVSQAPEQAPASAPAPGSEAGRQAFERLNCTMCHSIGGVGSPASPLDGVGTRLDRAQLRAWTTGSGVAAERLPAGIARRKAAARDDPELEALLDYLEQSK